MFHMNWRTIFFVWISLHAADGATVATDCITSEEGHVGRQQQQHFTEVGQGTFLHSQSKVRTSPNCLFPQYDAKLKRWDRGGFCLEETMTGGACVGKILDSNSLYYDIYYPRLDGHDILYHGVNESTFIDVSVNSKIANESIKSNACLIFDVDNDGDNDIYVSTVGDVQFYLYINNGNGTFYEDAMNRGLGNSKPGNALTAGFTLSTADFNNDGYLDVISTEWLPWLDEVSSVNCEVNDSGPHCKIEIHDIDSAVEYFNLIASGKAHNATVNMTNSRLFRNNPHKPGYFQDITVQANIQQSYKSQSKRNKFMGSTCKKIAQEELNEILDYFEESTYYNDKRNNVNVNIRSSSRKQFRKMVNIFSNSKRASRRMNFTKDKFNENEYIYLKLSGKLVADPGILSLIVQPKASKQQEYNLAQNAVDIVVSGKEIEKPMLKRNHYTWKSIAKKGSKFNRLDLEVGGLYGLKTYNVGFKCNMENTGCEFDLYVYIDHDIKGTYANPDCIDGRAQVVAQAGDFMVDLVSPWMKSEPFVLHVVTELKRLNVSGVKGREILANLFMAGNRLDNERYDTMLKTSQRISKEIAHLDRDTRARELNNMKEHQHGKRKMNHLLSFPLVGSFQFSAQFSDLDEDGNMDLIISGDFGTSAIYWNNGNGENITFTKGNFNFLEDLLDNSMGATVGDWDLDGKLDVMFTSTSISTSDLTTLNQVAATAGMLLSFRGNHLYKNVGGRLFEDVTLSAGIRESGWGWGAFFFDLDNDGDLDVLNGNGMDDPETTDDDFAVNQKMKLYINQGYEDHYAMKDEAFMRGIQNTKENRGAMVFDYDNDGDLDVFVVNHADTPSIYRNDGGNYYDYIRVQVKEQCGRNSIGAKVYILVDDIDDVAENTKEQLREIGNSAAFLGQSEAIAHFGLGLRRKNVYRLRVVWPKINGRQDTIKFIYNIPTRSHIVLYRDDRNSTIDLQSMRLGKCRSSDPRPLTEMETPIKTKPSKNLATEIKRRFQRAEQFFRQRITEIDRILQKKEELMIEDNIFLEMLGKKYPFVSKVEKK